MLTTLSRRNASANRRASRRSVFAAYPAFSLVLNGSTMHKSPTAAVIASAKCQVGVLASTAIAVAVVQRAVSAANPAGLRGKRSSHSRSPVGVIAHAWKNALCKSIPMY